MFCSISGTVPQEPVVSKKTGHLFEKALIDSHIERTGMCPFSGQSLSKDDLLSINSTTQTFTPPPCPLSATTIPGLLRCMKTEWEAIMLEQFALRTTLESTRQELTDLKHKQEAACRVIARLQVERDEARAMLQQVEASANSITLRRKEEELRAEESNPIFEDAVRKVEEFRVAARRTRTVCKKDSTYLDALTLSTEMSLYDDSERVTTASILTNSGQLISVSNSAATILNARRREILGTVRFFNAEARGNSRSENKPVHITCVDHSGGSGGGGHATFPSVDLYVAGGSDGSLRLVDAENLTLKNTVPSWAHPGSIRSIVSHFGTPYVFSGCSEGHILVGDLDKNVRISSQVAPGPVTSLVLHPDGNVLGVLAESCFLGLDTRVSLRQAVWTAMVPEPDMLSCASLSQNGYHVATGSRGGQIQLWDLRRTPDMEVVATHCCNDEIASISIDGSGTLLAAAGPSSAAIHLFTIKPFQCCRALHLEPDTTGPIVGLHWSDALCISCDVASPPRLFVTTQQGLIQEYGVG